jgi:hypothetical protein
LLAVIKGMKLVCFEDAAPLELPWSCCGAAQEGSAFNAHLLKALDNRKHRVMSNFLDLVLAC